MADDGAVKTRSRKVAEIRAQITVAVRKIVRAVHTTGPLYAELVKAVIVAEKAELSRAIIARTIRAELEAEKRRRLIKHTNGHMEEVVKVHKGTAARYVMLARWEQGKWLKGDKHVETVEIEGHHYSSPVKALMSERHSFTRVFRAWRDAVRPALTDLTAVPVSAQDSAERIVKRLTLPLLVKENGQEIVRRVKVLESAEGLAALLRILHESPLAKEAERLRELEEHDVVRRPVSDQPRRKKMAAA